MNEYLEKDTFGFESSNDESTFDYNTISGLGESDYENEDLFNTEVSNNNEDAFEIFKPQILEDKKEDFMNNVEIPIDYQTIQDEENNSFDTFETQAEQPTYVEDSVEQNIEEVPNSYEQSIEEEPVALDAEMDVNENIETTTTSEDELEQPVFVGYNFETENSFDQKVEETSHSYEPSIEEESVVSESEVEEPTEDLKLEQPIVNNDSINVDNEFLDDVDSFNSSIEEDYVLPVVEPTVESKPFDDETPIEDLNKLTEFKEEKIQTTDIKSLFDRVGVNVKEASDIFKKNTEMKEKIDTRFEELKKLQSEVEKNKKSQYDEINAYKEEVLNKLNGTKEEIEKRLNKLKEFQTTLEKEKEEFEQYRKTEKEEIERVQKEVQDAYDSRREELNHIEDVLRKQKDALDEERSQLSLDRIQYESDKNELANNLLKFNEIVDSFTNGMDKINKE